MPPAALEWAPAAAEALTLVLGAHSGAGVSTVALAIATAAGEARVVECCTVASSGLAAAADAELGVTAAGWVQGSRGPVLIERRGDRILSQTGMPFPGPTTKPLTVLDCAGDVDVLAASPGWLGELVRTLPTVVVVARPTIPGLRRLEAAVSLLGPERVRPVLIGAERRLPRLVEQSLGPAVRRLRSSGLVSNLPADHTLAIAGITPEALPAALVAACSDLVTSTKGNPQ